MSIIEEYVQITLDQKAITQTLIDFLNSEFGLKTHHIKNIELENFYEETKVIQCIIIGLTGVNVFEVDNITNVKGVKIITPNQLIIEVGEIPL